MGLAIRILRPMTSSVLQFCQSNKAVHSYYSGPERDLEHISTHLSKFEGGSIILQKDEISGIAKICLCNPTKRNALTGKMMVELHKVVCCLEEWDKGKGVILYGEGGNFCSGGDLNFARQTCNAHDGFLMATFMQDTLKKLQNLPIISVALIEGIGALGGGAELAVSCDFRLIQSEAAGIGFVHGRMGIIPAWGGVTWLINLLGYNKALDVLLTSKVVTPDECLSIGLANAIISSNQPLKDAIEWLKKKNNK